ncbi:GntR family transcriptional regulator [Pseudooceanicola sp. 502str34]
MSEPMTKLSLEPLVQAWEAQDSAAPGTTKYARLAGAFGDCIESGAYAPGDHLPGETEICAALPLGLSTVQKALSQLVEEGLIVRRRKAGSFIADQRHQVPEVHVYRFRDPVSGEILMPFTRMVGVHRVATAEFGPLLTGFGCEEAIRIDRMVWVTGEPPAFSSLFLRPEHGGHLPGQSLEALHGISYHRLLWEDFRVRTHSVRHSVCADLLSRQACASLDLAAPHVGMVWDAYEEDRAGKLQLVQRFELPRGHRPMELIEAKAGF